MIRLGVSMRPLVVSILIVLGLAAGAVRGQSLKALQPTTGVSSNTVQTLAADGDSLWVGPLLTVYVEAEAEEEQGQLFFAEGDAVEQRLLEGGNVVVSLATRGGTGAASSLWAGLAFEAGGGAIGAGGFLVSTNGGRSFEARPAPLDAAADTTVAYGASTLPAVPVTQEAGAYPRALALQGRDTVWVASGRAGLRRSTDRGTSWARVVLPPDTSTRIVPSRSYDFLAAPPQGDGRGFQNYRALSVLVDATGTVWAGTVAGLNRSTPSDVAPGGDRAWRLFRAEAGARGLPGQIVSALAEQPRPNARNPVWVATLRAETDGPLQRSGLAVTPDGGATFRQALLGVQVNDVAARQGRVYAAAESGLYVSDNQGATWRTIETVSLAADQEGLLGGLTARAVEVTPSALWVGTTEGLLRLDRGEETDLLPARADTPPPTWELFRTEVPVRPDSPTERVPRVDTYAYPNPFVPSRDGGVRIVYDVPAPQPVTVSIYDFGMNRVRVLRDEEPEGRQEMVWDGTDGSGLRLPTGTYLYTVEVGGETVRGKILLTN